MNRHRGVHIGAYVPKEQKQWLIEEAKRRGTSVSEVLRELIRDKQK